MVHSAVLAWVWALALGVVPGVQAGCADLGRCCQGRDLTCVSRGWTAAGPSLEPQPCYCDQACSGAGDCCPDYGSACPAVTCAVSEWSGWSRCIEPCTVTFRVRRREVLREPRNGGGPCPALEERAGCVEYWSDQGVECKQALRTSCFSGRPLAIPAVEGPGRDFNSWKPAPALMSTASCLSRGHELLLSTHREPLSFGIMADSILSISSPLPD
ncbi:somatomedin-B and thrombospondin type-1 domain-containing protein-like isoform X2 [Sarcophilus harrisii]|uniref:somatomedin-B and thrombospondin type-1 domain-containing protein-like isoform X2 n=1 Tax=Sarcophilus harrisii TaxID=9305 RepID=UPI001301D3AE|nr:somatomedin-B and thrombospondin type-1 domain-containing protein-like isoform X2 [Sarcophilus harrisii]